MKCIKCNTVLPEGAIYCHMCGKKQVQEKRKTLKRANGMGTVYKLSGRRKRPWLAAKNKVIIGYYEKKTDALEALEHIAGTPLTERYNMTFAQVFQEWKEDHYKSLTKSGINSYNIAYNVFAPLHNKKFRDLRTADFQKVLEPHMHKANSTIAKYKQLITQMSQWAIREEICTTNFAKFVRLPESVKKEKEIFTDEEIDRIKADGSETARIIIMLLSTGMRIGELFSLPLADYHENYIIGGSKTEAGRNRIIPISPEGRAHFAYFAAQATGELLLSGYVGNKKLDNFRKRDYYPLLDRLNIPHKSPHATRHTYTSKAVKAGMPPEILQKILGHADYSTTANIYTHIDIETMIKYVESADVTDALLTNE